MNNKVIEVLDYLCAKFGVVIDWTSNNIWPQVTEFMARYATYSIVRAVAWIAICTIGVVASVIFLKKIYKSYKNHAFWYDEELFCCIATALCIGVALFSIGGIFDNIFVVIDWAFIPEMKFIEAISSMVE